MNEENRIERQLREVLSHTEPLTIQEVEDEIMSMLTCLQPLPIVMQRVKGLSVEEGFIVSDEFEDLAYRWEVGQSQCNGISLFFTMALYEALEYRTKQLFGEQARALSDAHTQETDKREEQP